MAKILRELSDYQLLQVLRENNEKGFNILFDRYFHRIYGFSDSLLHDSEIAKELAMDVMTRFWQRRTEINLGEDETFLPYLFQSTRNAVLNHLRKARMLTLPLDIFSELGDVSLPADARLSYAELERRYLETVNKMPEQRRKIFLLNREEELSYSEIAERLNISIHTVRNQMSSSLQYFRKHLGDYNKLVILLMTTVLLKISDW